MADLENVKWRYFTEAEKQAIREEFKKLAEEEDEEEDADLDPDEIIDWEHINLDTAYQVIGKITLEEFAKIHNHVFSKDNVACVSDSTSGEK